MGISRSGTFLFAYRSRDRKMRYVFVGNSAPVNPQDEKLLVESDFDYVRVFVKKRDQMEQVESTETESKRINQLKEKLLKVTIVRLCM